jgi:hypothetical protein
LNLQGISINNLSRVQEKKKRKAAALKRAKNGKDKPKTKDGEEIDKDMIRKSERFPSSRG